MRAIVITLLLATGAPTLAAAPAEKPMAAAPKVKQCINLRNIGGTRIADDRTLYYREGRQWYRNDIRGGCAGLRPDRAISSRTPSTRLCSGDIITVFEPSSRIEFGSCGLGDFTPVDGPPPTRR